MTSGIHEQGGINLRLLYSLSLPLVLSSPQPYLLSLPKDTTTR